MKKLLVALVALFFSALALAAVNINNASKEELDSLKGIGPVKAQAIIDYRNQNGPFKSLDDIKKVKGIGDKTYDEIKGDITLSGATTVPKKEEKKAPEMKKAEPAPTAAPAKEVKKEAAPAKEETKKETAKEEKAAKKKEKAAKDEMSKSTEPAKEETPSKKDKKKSKKEKKEDEMKAGKTDDKK